jgi:hypothetical protein
VIGVKKGFIRIALLLVLLQMQAGAPRAQNHGEIMSPCSVVLQPVKDIGSAQGTALVTKVKKPYTNKPNSSVRERILLFE